jgi:hypothetical protein
MKTTRFTVCMVVAMATALVVAMVVSAVHLEPAAALAPPASALALPASAQVFTPPVTITADCTQDVTKALYDWINTLPQGTPDQPTEVQFAPGGCYQVDGMVLLRGLADFIFDGQGATFKQSRVVNGELANDPPPNRAAYCGFANRFVNAAGTIPAGFDIMWFVEGGCDLVFENMTIEGTNTKGRPGGERQQDSAIQVSGAQRILITADTISAVWGDFVTVTGLHEAPYGGLYFPAFDVTISDNTLNRSGRQGVSVVYADRVAVTGNSIRNVAATAIDLEAEVGGGVEGDIAVSNNAIHHYQYLVAAITYAQLFDFAFTGNVTGPTKIDLDSETKFPGHDLAISGNRSVEATDWPNPSDIVLTNESHGLVDDDTVPLGPPTPDFVHASDGSGLIAVQSNVLARGSLAPRGFLPDPVTAQSSAVATGCDNTFSTGVPLDGRDSPSTLAQCVTVTPNEPAAPILPTFLTAGADIAGAQARSDVAAPPARSSAAAASQSTDPGGPQSGSVACSGVSGMVTFNPPLTDGGTSPEVALAQVTLTGCVGADGATSPDAGYGTVSLFTPTDDCASLDSGGAPIATSLAVGWSPTTLGTSAIGFSGFSLLSNGDAGFSLGGAGTSVSGSYPGDDAGASTTATAFSTMSTAEIAAACGSADGLESLTLAGGSLSVG